MLINADQLVSLVAAGMLPFARITGMCMIVPVFGAQLVPVRIRVLFSVVLTAALMPAIEPVPPAEVMSLQSLVAVGRELVVGLALGFLIQMIFDAMVIAGQSIAMSMGLGYATMVDPSRGNIPVLSQFYVITATLLFLSLNGHLAVLKVLADSFEIVPPGAASLGRADVASILSFGTTMFAGALQIALPAVASLLIVNVAFGVVSRAAPSLNLFAVGFPITMMMGFVVLTRSIETVAPVFTSLLDDATQRIYGILLGG